MSGAHEHIEHIEHAEHAGHAQDPFDKRVAVSVAIVAAVLAGISMLGHRKHNEVLELQGDANRLMTEASILQTKSNVDHTHATDQWGFYQAKNIREHMYTANLGLLNAMARDPAKAKDAEALQKKMQKQVDKYQKELPGMMKVAQDLTKSGEQKKDEALKKKGEARVILHDSHFAHHQADRLDFAHLGAEIGIVLSSLALMTRKRFFWFAGLGSTIIAICLVISAYSLPHPTHSELLDDGEGAGAVEQHH